MHKLMEYLCDELEELERKVEKEGKLSAAEIQYADVLAHTKKNLLKAEEMWDESEYSMEGGGGSYAGSYDGGRGQGGRGGSYARRGGGGRGGRGGRTGANQYGSYAGGYSRMGYSMANDSMVEELHRLMQEAPDDQTRQEFQKLIQKLEQM